MLFKCCKSHLKPTFLRKLDGKVIHSQHSDDDEEEEGDDAAAAAPARSERSSVRDSDEEGEDIDGDEDIGGGTTLLIQELGLIPICNRPTY